MLLQRVLRGRGVGQRVGQRVRHIHYGMIHAIPQTEDVISATSMVSCLYTEMGMYILTLWNQGFVPPRRICRAEILHGTAAQPDKNTRSVNRCAIISTSGNLRNRPVSSSSTVWRKELFIELTFPTSRIDSVAGWRWWIQLSRRHQHRCKRAYRESHHIHVRRHLMFGIVMFCYLRGGREGRAWQLR
ncbi:uncharacterized protein BJX67DRAFT_354429 [Aspergillus lucknowensis]|uniref:Uncharacterized protein n=1 Tax=Aspergillus lucknowensis TaxID=176173 RepID=A0ABR4LUA1_9EURO